MSGGESLALTGVNDELLRMSGGTWKAPPTAPTEGLGRDANRAIRVKAERVARSVLAEPFAWGDVRLCHTLGFWDEVLGERHVAVFVHRDPLRLAADLGQREDVSVPYALALWERYVREALRFLDGRPTYVAAVDDVDLDAVASFLDDVGVGRVGDSSAWPKPFEDLAEPTTEVLTDAQSALRDVVEGLIGGHRVLRVPRLPSETQWAHLLIEERRRSELDRLKTAGALRAAVQTVASHMRPVVPAEPLPIGPSYGKDASEDASAYRRWLDRTEKRRVARRHEIADGVNGRADAPTISVVVPVYRPDLALLRRCVASVQCQVYGRWELVLCDDGSADPAVDRFLDDLVREDERIVATRLPENGGISAATNGAIAASWGDFIGFLDQDDELEPGALAWVADALLGTPDVDVIYTDEDKLDEQGLRAEPFFKPDWSPDQLLSQMYLGHFLVVRRAVVEQVGFLRSDYDGSQDYDLALRASEVARRVLHIPEVLYHWRRGAGSTAQDYAAKPQADHAAQAALRDALRRRGDEGMVEPGIVPGTFRVRRRLTRQPLVSIIIPFRDGAGLLGRCIESLHETAGYDRWEALLVDNQSWEPETTALLNRIADDPKCRLLSYPHDFNWSAINNFAARQANGDVILLLNSDVEGRAQGWLEAMLEHAQRPEVGAVGARLLYPDGRVQHAGVLMGLGGVAWHSFCFCPADKPGYFSQAKLVRNYLAVTGACLMLRRDVFDDLNGIDEQLAVAFSDIDLCLRAYERGYRIVYTPFAELIHYEGASRGVSSRELVETRVMMERWERYIRRDPYFNPNLDTRRSEHTVPIGDEEVTTWERLRSMLEIL